MRDQHLEAVATPRRHVWNPNLSGKPSATEELADRLLLSPLGALVARGLLNLPISPNQVTVLGAIAGVGAAVAWGIGGPEGLLTGCALLFAALVLDCSDGLLARARRSSSRFGRLLDGYCDYVVAVTVHFGILWYLFGIPRSTLVELPGGELWSTTWMKALVVAAAGATMALHSALFDSWKRRYQDLTKPDPGQTDSPEDVERAMNESRSPIERALFRVFLGYVRVFFREASKKAPYDRAVAEAYDRHMARPLVVLGLVGPSVHMLLRCVGAVLSVQSPTAFIGVLFFIIGPTNLVMLLAFVLRASGRAGFKRELAGAGRDWRAVLS